MIRFENPEWLLAFFILIPVGLFIVWETSKKIFEVERFGQAGKYHIHFSQLMKSLIFTVMIGSLVFALINPQVVRERKLVSMSSESQIAAVFDVSKSMAARKDIESPDRLSRAKEIFAANILYLSGAEMAIFAFTDVFLSHIPFTSNHELVKLTLERAVRIESIPRPGSDLIEVFEEISKKFDLTKEEKIILLFTNGEFTTGEKVPEEILENLKSAGITLVVVGVGEREGAKIPIFDKNGEFTGLYVLSRATGLPHVSYLDEENLVNFVQDAGGYYFNENDSVGIANFFFSSLDIHVIETATIVEDHTDIYSFLVGFAFMNFVLLIKLYN